MSMTADLVARGSAAHPQRLGDLVTLCRGIRLFTEPFDLHEALQGLAELVLTDLGVDFVGLWLRESLSIPFRLTAQAKVGGLRPNLKHWSPSEVLLERIASYKEPLVLPDREVGSGGEGPRLPELNPLPSLLSVVLSIEGRPLGILALLTQEPRPFSAGQIATVEALAASASVAVSNARRRKEQDRRTAEAQELEEISRLIGSAREVREMLRKVSRRAAQLCGATRASVFLWDKRASRLFPAMAQLASGEANEGNWARFKKMGQSPLHEMPLTRRLIKTGKPVTLDDARGSPQIEQEWVQAFDVRSILGVPLIAGGEVIGTLMMDTSGEVRPFGPRQIELALAVADQVAFAIQKALLLQETQDRLRQTQAQLAISRTLSSTLKLDRLLLKIARQAAHACAMDRCSFYLWEKERVVPVMAQFADGRPVDDLWHAFKGLGHMRVEELPIFHQTVKKGGPVVVEDPAHDPRIPAAMQGAFHLKAVLVVPLIRQEKVVGAMALDNTECLDPVTPEQVSLATTIASQVALAIDNAHLYGETQRRLTETQAHLEIAHTLSSTLELGPLLKRLTQQAARACDMDRCSVHIWEEGRIVPLMAQYADGRVNEHHWRVFKELQRKRVEELPYLVEMIRCQGPVIIADPATDPLWPAFLRVLENKAILVVPLVRQEEMVGTMILTNNDRLEPVTAEQAALATALASQVALAVENARLYEETGRRLGETRALLSVAQTIGGSLDRQEIARQTCRQLTQLLGADTSIFFEIEEADVLGVAGYRVPEEIRALGRGPLDEKRLAFFQAIRMGVPVATSDLSTDPRFAHVEMEALPIRPRSLLYVPVLSQGTELGALLSLWWGESHEFSDDHLRLGAGIASQMALVLENARHYEQAQRALADLKATQDRLVQSEKFRALAEMAGGVAHDFRNLLTAIRGRAQLLQQQMKVSQLTPKEIQANLDVIELAALDGAETVRRLLEYTQSEVAPGGQAVVDVNQILAHIKEVSEPRWKDEAEGRGLKIEVTLNPGVVPSVSGNPTELREVLLNLVFNAIEAMPLGGALTLSSGSENDCVWARVMDTGIGIPDGIRQRIFDPFFTTKGTGSSGLGLSSSYGIVHRHGGEIEVESEPGRGTSFTVKLPVEAPSTRRRATPRRTARE